MPFLPKEPFDYRTNDSHDLMRPGMPLESIDHTIQSYDQSFDGYYGQSHQNPPQMMRYLDDEMNSTRFGPLETHFGAGLAITTTNSHMATRYPSHTLRRGDSPFSPQYSSTCSAIQSPPAESDLFYDGTQGPSTPPDAAMTTPYYSQKTAHDHWGGRNLQLMGFASAVPITGGVKLSEISFDPAAQAEGGTFDNDLDMILDPIFALQSPGMSAFEDGHHGCQIDLSLQTSDNGLDNGIKVAAHTDAPSQDVPLISPVPKTLNEDRQDAMQLRSGSGSGAGQLKKASTRKKTPQQKKTRPNRTTKRSTVPSTLLQSSTEAAAPSNSSQDDLKLFATESSTTARPCKECNAHFADDALLRKQLRAKHHRAFPCVFAYAGCSSIFATKNEWKRHVASQHLALDYWLCSTDACAAVHTQAYTGSSGRSATHHKQRARRRSASLPTRGAVFNRKDLYTQHVRRMHAPPSISPLLAARLPPPPSWLSTLRSMQDAALRRRCSLPIYMRCPAAPRCQREFNGVGAWDERMEHVARHLEAVAKGTEAALDIGGEEDVTLTKWASREGVGVTRRMGNGWELCNPLKDAHLPLVGRGETAVREEDAEGEEC